MVTDFGLGVQVFGIRVEGLGLRETGFRWVLKTFLKFFHAFLWLLVTIGLRVQGSVGGQGLAWRSLGGLGFQLGICRVQGLRDPTNFGL